MANKQANRVEIEGVVVDPPRTFSERGPAVLRLLHSGQPYKTREGEERTPKNYFTVVGWNSPQLNMRDQIEAAPEGALVKITGQLNQNSYVPNGKTEEDRQYEVRITANSIELLGQPAMAGASASSSGDDDWS